MSRLDWERARAREIGKASPRPKGSRKEPVVVHPNSPAARKWGRKLWR